MANEEQNGRPKQSKWIRHEFGHVVCFMEILWFDEILDFKICLTQVFIMGVLYFLTKNVHQYYMAIFA